METLGCQDVPIQIVDSVLQAHMGQAMVCRDAAD